MSKLLKIALVGAPNAGKSTLLNTMLGMKISIVTPKVQTTREVIRGVITDADTQLVFLDTPGIFKPTGKLEKYIVKNAVKGVDEADISCLIMDPKKGIPSKEVFSVIGRSIAVINKVDKMRKEDLLDFITKLQQEHEFEQFFLISALKNDGVEDLIKYFTSIAVESPWIYSADEVTDSPMKKIAEEITREKLFLLLNQELPYSLKVEAEKWEETETSIKIYQAITVDKESHKHMIIGKYGTKIAKVGKSSRIELEKMTGKKVHLFLFVKVKEDWILKDY